MYEERILALEHGDPRRLLLGGRPRLRNNVTSQHLSVMVADGTLPKLVGRLWSTWLPPRPADSVPLLMEQARLKTVRPLEDLLEYAAPFDGPCGPSGCGPTASCQDDPAAGHPRSPRLGRRDRSRTRPRSAGATDGRGRPRQLPVRTLLVGIKLAVDVAKTACLTDVHAVLIDLPRSVQQDLGVWDPRARREISVHQVRRLFSQ
jgi:hypothetical protein